MKIALSVALIVLSSLYTHTLLAQAKNKKFGKLDDQYVSMQVYEPDTSADAVILYNRGIVEYQLLGDGLKLVHTYHKRIKVLRAGGLDQADISIPYIAASRIEDVTEIKAITHYEDENGKIIHQKLNRKDIIDEDRDGYVHQKKFAFPNARVGAVLEYTYKVYTDYLFSMNNWYFQREIPVAYSEYETRLPRDFDFRHLTLGEQFELERERRSTQLTVWNNQQWTVNILTYTCKDIPALSREPHITSMKNYYFRLELQLRTINLPGAFSSNYLKSWGELSKQLMESDSYGGQIKTPKALKEQLGLILAGTGDSTEAKINRIYKWVQSYVKWDKRRGLYPNKKLATLYKEKTANGTSINLLLLTMLREAGLNAYPMLVCTRSNGLPQSVFPTLRQFNHTIVYVNTGGDDYVLLDAINKFTPANMLPMPDLNMQGMVLAENSAKWVPIKPQHQLKKETHAIFKLRLDGSLEGSIKNTDYGYAAANRRASMGHTDNHAAYLHKQMTHGFTEAEVSSMDVQFVEELNEPLKVKCGMETSDFVQMSGDFIYLQPMLNQAIKENPFKLEKRSYPVDFAYPRNHRYILSITLPEGYVVDESPKPARIVLPNRDAVFTYQFMNSGSVIQLMSHIEIPKTTYNSEEYPFIKEFYELIVAKHAEQIVLKKQ